ncbi:MULTISPECIES: putative holin-like toxin [Listeria]|nr:MULTISPECIES: putative holin-like toxin [Listeria]
MSVYETMALMLGFGTFIIALLGFMVVLIRLRKDK